MGSIVLKSLSILLGVFFIFVGITKITPFISKELHKDLRKEYVRYAKVFPLTEMLDFKLPSKWYRRTVGGLEILFGLALALIPSRTEMFLGEPFEKSSFEVRRAFPYLEMVPKFVTMITFYQSLLHTDKIKNTANVGLVLLMMLAAYSHVMVGDPFDRSAPALVFFFMLSGRLVVWYQISRRESMEKAATTQNGNGLKRD